MENQNRVRQAKQLLKQFNLRLHLRSLSFIVAIMRLLNAQGRSLSVSVSVCVCVWVNMCLHVFESVCIVAASTCSLLWHTNCFLILIQPPYSPISRLLSLSPFHSASLCSTHTPRWTKRLQKAITNKSNRCEIEIISM